LLNNNSSGVELSTNYNEPSSFVLPGTKLCAYKVANSEKQLHHPILVITPPTAASDEEEREASGTERLWIPNRITFFEFINKLYVVYNFFVQTIDLQQLI
jgi:hypothetical protein